MENYQLKIDTDTTLFPLFPLLSNDKLPRFFNVPNIAQIPRCDRVEIGEVTFGVDHCLSGNTVRRLTNTVYKLSLNLDVKVKFNTC